MTNRTDKTTMKLNQYGWYSQRGSKLETDECHPLDSHFKGL